ncbi:hypothetical protein PGTUg99_017599 [Puccinia graminis f. sp. tritici]|uniref:Uncharacterized protein n=1 Tax=Puccinia graminis f. sp. tritici TaxID=56615 RepID=A0A5B0SBD0_PUCGR|nr:hypothetical protein PGTUg99_017599 [Puccinia graminis f. sp. tritici]
MATPQAHSHSTGFGDSSSTGDRLTRANLRSTNQKLDFGLQMPAKFGDCSAWLEPENPLPTNANALKFIPHRDFDLRFVVNWVGLRRSLPTLQSNIPFKNAGQRPCALGEGSTIIFTTSSPLERPAGSGHDRRLSTLRYLWVLFLNLEI